MFSKKKFSIGEFFNQRSENLQDIVSKMSPPKHDPVPLVDDSPTQPVDLGTAFEMAKWVKCRLSTIENEINNIGTDDSAQKLVNNLRLAMNKKNELNNSTNNQIPTSNEVRKYFLDRIPSKISKKENVDPKYRNIQLSDTISFTQSLLNSTELKEMENSFDKTISPESSKCKEDNVNNNMRISVSTPICDTPKRPLSKSPSSSTELAGSEDSGCNSKFSSRHGPIPLEASVLQLCWGSVKLHKNVKKSLQIKNTSTKRLVLTFELSGRGYQVVNAEDTTFLTLQPQECHTITISFCPSVIGAAVGKIRFSCILAEILTLSDVEIPLYGYGGHAAINVQDIFKEPLGSDFLPMGELRDLQKPLVKTITIYNRGPLTGFVVLLLDSMNLDLPHLCNCFKVTPKKVLILPESVATIQIKFNVGKNEIKEIRQKIDSVLTLANLQIIYGDQPTRQRIRNSIRQMNEKERSHIISQHLTKIWDELPDEEKYLADLHQSFLKMADVAEELISTLRTHNIALTLNNNYMNETNDSTLNFYEANETILCVSHTSRPNDETVTEEHLAVFPKRLQIHSFDPARKAFFTIQNKFKTPQDFQIESNFKHLFKFSENHGRIAPDNCHVIFVHYYRVSFLPSEEIYIEVKTNNKNIIVPVDISSPLFLS